MKCQRLHHIFSPSGEQPWMISHAANPILLPKSPREGDCYFISRDAQRRGHLVKGVFEPSNFSLKNSLFQLILSPGEEGLFDDSGISLGNICESKGERYLYYVGWNLGGTVPFRNSIGLAIAEEGSDDFKKVSPAPILDRSHVDPYHLSYPFVMEESGVFRMWYGSSLRWTRNPEEMLHVIKYAESVDGLHWKALGRVCIPLKDSDEIAVSRPWVWKKGEEYIMLYCSRKKSSPYSLGYATSRDGMIWKRNDEHLSWSGDMQDWEGEEQCYPSTYVCEKRYFLLYCGQGYGRTGFGLAEMSFH